MVRVVGKEKVIIKKYHVIKYGYYLPHVRNLFLEVEAIEVFETRWCSDFLHVHYSFKCTQTNKFTIKVRAFENIKKAREWARKTEGQYPSICQRLELGKDWESATKQLLGIQPQANTSLHRILYYSQG